VTPSDVAGSAPPRVFLEALGSNGSYRSRKTELIRDTAGAAVAELCLVPPLFVGRTLDVQRKSHPVPFDERARIIEEAAERFVDCTLAGLTFDEYVQLAGRVSGLPISLAAESAREVPAQCRTADASIRAAQPRGAALDWREERTRKGGAVWARRGHIYSVHASGNTVGLLGFWIEALLLGYRVAIRPSRREPFTVHRMVLALREAGLRPVDAVYLPTDYAGADELLRSADLSTVYGGQEVVDKYADNPSVFTNGPGRTKILITAERDWRDYLDVIVASISSHGGMACTNTTAVLYEGDPAPLAAAIGQRLAQIKPLPPHDPEAVLPTQPSARAQEVAAFLADRACGATPLLGADQVVVDVGGGFSAMRPAVHLLAEPNIQQLNTELPFPCVWVSPWTRSDGIAPLRDSLVVNAITSDAALLDALIDEPTVTNVYSGRFATDYRTPNMPHDGYPADFLMRNKGCIRE
jgi:acyl-CoA reductase-like NAD-dependent aldehyde dehydrogenase